MLLQGNTYNLPVRVKDPKGNIVTSYNVKLAQFVFGKFEKYYGQDGVVTFDEKKKAFIVPFSEEETFELGGNIKYQARFVFDNGKISGTKPRITNILSSITKTRIGGVSNVL